ncbi:MAG TPA: hypothetical protein VFS43_44650 [Polyangiaceae bacterium]|nr:hypothetical protein [Polyangiaceae bacterium]
MSERKSTRRRLAAAAASAWLALAGAARAEPGPLPLVAEGYDEGAAERLRAALERELGRPVVRSEGAPEGEAVLVTRRPAGRDVQIVYLAPGGQRLERGLRVQGDAERAEGEVALLAGNLARDESSALIARLPPGEAGAKAAAGGAGPPADESPCETRKHPAVALGGDVLPYLGLSSSPRGRAAARSFSVNLLGGLSRGTLAAELSGAVNIDTEFVCGAQAAGAVNVVGGPLEGAQIAGAANVVTGPARGAQIAGAANYAGRGARGVQAAGGANVALGPLSGAQAAGGANVALGPSLGGQAAGGANLALGPWTGAQAAGGFNLAGYVGASPDREGARAASAGAARPWGVSGLQAAGGVNVAIGPPGDRGQADAGPAAGAGAAGRGARAAGATGALEGAQIAGALNVAVGDVRGAQIAPINVASGRVRGVQIGVINVAEDVDFALGLINVVSKGRLHLDAWIVPEVGLGAAALKHGGRHFHYLYGVGLRAADQKPWYVFGLGAHLPLSEGWYVDADAITYGRLAPRDLERDEGRGINQLRVVAGYSVAPGLALYGGPSANVALRLREDGPPTRAPYARELEGTRALGVYAWPGLVLGVQGL